MTTRSQRLTAMAMAPSARCNSQAVPASRGRSLKETVSTLRHRNRCLSVHRAANPLARVDTSELTPLEYERHCADLLKAKGWTVQMTPATRDGGADFFVEKHEWRMVVQSKRYAQPVGNKAVQEVTPALLLYNGNVACVAAPTGFTRQAQTRSARSQGGTAAFFSTSSVCRAAFCIKSFSRYIARF